jgi:hypothetical protein
VIGWVAIFDVTSQPFRWGNAGEGLAAFAVVALGAAASFALRRRGSRWGTAVLAVASGVAVYFAIKTVEHRREHAACIDAARRGEGRVVEGVVKEFRPVRSLWQRPSSESFVLDGTTIQYPLLSAGCGFHQTVAEGGPIREGMRVRLLEWKGKILRLEVEEGAVTVPGHSHGPL